jgi:predicted alpha/beta superfamily hydrolase
MFRVAILLACITACSAANRAGRDAVSLRPDAKGRLEILQMQSRIFGNTRQLRVWLPIGYDEPENSNRSYPVLYLNDGQNLFDASTAVFGSTAWEVDETATELQRAGRMQPIVVVGIDNAGRRGRAREYLPYPDEFLRPPEPDPQGRLYGDFLAEDVIPLVEQRFRVERHREGRALGGSSYGALAAVYAAVSRPALFSKLLLESPSFYVDDNHILRDVAAADLDLDRVYLGVGTNELGLPECPEHPGNAEAVEGVMRMANILHDAGLREGDQVRVVVEECAVHDEAAWAARLPSALEFLFPSRFAR